MASIFKKKGVWFLDYYFNGKRIRKSLKSSSKRLAKLALSDLQVKLAKNDLGLQLKDSTVEQHCQNFLEYQKARVTQQTYKRMGSVLRVNFIPFMQEHHTQKLTQITPWVIEKYLSFRAEQLKDSSANYELGVIKNLLTKAVEWNCLTLNPASKVKFLKVRDQKPPRFLSLDEVNALLAVCKGQLYFMVVIALNTGMRSSEVCQLEWPDIDLDKKIIAVVNDGVRTTKSKKTRHIPVKDELSSLLKTYKENHGAESGRLFVRKSGKLMDVVSYWCMLKRAYVKTGITGAHVHTLRHTFASHLVMNGVDLYTVAKLLGHSKPQTTQIYAHLAPEHLRSAIAHLPCFSHPKDTIANSVLQNPLSSATYI